MKHCRYRPDLEFGSVEPILRILLIAPFFPLPLQSGGHTRLFNIIKNISRRHVIDFVALSGPCSSEDMKAVKGYCRLLDVIDVTDFINHTSRLKYLLHSCTRLGMLLKGIPLEASGFYFPSLQREIHRLLRMENYDVVQVEYPRMALHLAPPVLDGYRGATVLEDYDLTFVAPWRRYCNAKSLPRRWVYCADYHLQKRFALAVWSRFDRLVVVSETDSRKVRKVAPGQDVHVVPNGVDLEICRMLPRVDTPPQVILLGGAGHWANVDAYNYFVAEIFPIVKRLIPGISLSVIGTGWATVSRNCRDPAINFTGFVKDLLPYLSGSTVLVAPIRVGGGTRLKILEAMAMGVPVVSTQVGFEGIDAVSGTHLLSAETPRQFAENVSRLFADTGLCRKLIHNARLLVEERYSWESVALRMEEVYERAR